MFYETTSGRLINLDLVKSITRNMRKVEGAHPHCEYSATFHFADDTEHTATIYDYEDVMLPSQMIPALPGYFLLSLGVDDDDTVSIWKAPVIAWSLTGRDDVRAIGVDDTSDDNDILCPDGSVIRPLDAHYDDIEAWKKAKLEEQRKEEERRKEKASAA